MAVNVSAKFTKNTDLYNGLNHIEKDLLDDPTALRTAVVKYRVKFAKQDFEHGGAATPTVKIEHFEPMNSDEAARQASELAQAAYKARTGGELQPDLFDQPDEDDFDPDPADPDPAPEEVKRKRSRARQQ